MRSFAAIAGFVAAANAWAYNYTAPPTESTTLTITNCPCTISKPVYTPPYYPPGNSSAPYVPAPTGTGVPTSVYPTSTPTPSEFPGAAGKAGLSLLAVAGALAAFL
ncbi:hypothetical protein BU26DRAFT_192681 [Trematosphaeria pertusa]|uniref:Uncharacterized protein n=1 Tax=Trematosphaeria pertusa TaxID=390896 RepID=A0A6A6HRR0_9PLEO|nr:uncharacterized protein BU26DRAFT_192681 [Trematosphaeria pertusa]KAF2240844.1 hypothetical protein BU26DRAFT_192681 [Trematosphaeria pertusa]